VIKCKDFLRIHDLEMLGTSRRGVQRLHCRAGR
jgi:hypothetical protein